MSKYLKDFILGTLTGLVSPMAGLFIYWLFTWTQYNFIPDFFVFMHEHRMVAAHLGMACLVNLPIFYLVINKESKYKFAQGIIFGTLAYAIYIFYYKLFITGE